MVAEEGARRSGEILADRFHQQRCAPEIEDAFVRECTEFLAQLREPNLPT